MSKTAFVFPGQGSQSVGMMSAFAAQFPQVEARFREASEVLGENLWDLVEQGPREQLDLTWNTQPAMLVAGVVSWEIWRASGGATPLLPCPAKLRIGVDKVAPPG